MAWKKISDLLGEAVCASCRVTKPLSSFLKRGDTDAYKNRCRECENEERKLHSALQEAAVNLESNT